jgi:Zn-dependent alcohol dehydrogenase
MGYTLEQLQDTDFGFEARCTVDEALTFFLLGCSLAIQGWGTTVATSVLRENASILPSHLLNGRTLKGTMYGGFKTRSDLPELVERYLRKVQTTDPSSLPSFLPSSIIIHAFI